MNLLFSPLNHEHLNARTVIIGLIWNGPYNFGQWLDDEETPEPTATSPNIHTRPLQRTSLGEREKERDSGILIAVIAFATEPK
ncbi:hypothetical protein AVEN_43502-1 [Araneus ventricosus]|uniref:Uncharacterized protein n=1 Tax=Araneus ventricosus TaxID=182803 RepID=A0A4Y2F4W5_ARAVE|nr:hypothetical protein AVEN_43502-1 [Araneus ventricosus]